MPIPTPALIILIGPSSSGKTTWASQNFEPNEVVSSDALRAMVGAGEDDQTAGTVAFELLEQIVVERLRRGMTTVVDTLGFDEPAHDRWIGLASKAGMESHAAVFETPRDVCERRNGERARPLPKAVLRKQFTRFQEVVASLEGSAFTTVHQVNSADRMVTDVSEPTVHVDRGVTSGAAHTFGLIASRFNWQGDDLAAELAEIATRAETAGFRDLWVMDHFRQIPQVGRAWEDMPEAYAALSFMAGVTKSIRLGALVTGITHRQPVVLGKMLATLDVLSSGRAIAGLGIAWDKSEHMSYGIEFLPTPTRYELLEETLQMLPLLWGKGSPSFEGKHIKAPELVCYPRPIQDPIPILIGGSGEKKTLLLVAKYANAANLFGDPATIRHKVEVLRDHCADVDRDPSEVEVTHLTPALTGTDRPALMARVDLLRDRNQTADDYLVRNRGGTVDRQVERFEEYSSAGATHSIVSLPDVAREGSIETFGEVIQRFASP